MQKIYFKILGASIFVLLSINIVSFVVDFNIRQLINPSFFNERVTAIYYLMKNIIVETGVHIDKTDEDDINRIIEKAADMYEIDKNLLSVLINEQKEYSMTLTGGMGLTTISTTDFLKSSFSNPYNPEENIMAAAETIGSLQENGLNGEDIIMRFIIGSNEENIKTLAGSEYTRAVELASKYRTIRQ